MGYLKFAFAAAYTAGILMHPGQALHAARSAMELWYRSVAPALFPFAAMMPYLTSPQARYIYDKLLGRFMALFGLPGRCAPAFVTGLFAGSPGGAMAAASVAQSEGLSSGQASRLAGICCGMSPVYLVSGLGTALLNSPETGWRFALSQWSAIVIVGIAFRGMWKKDSESGAVKLENSDKGIMNAVIAVLRACGYMVLFSVGLAVAEKITGFNMKSVAVILDLPGSAAVAIENRLDETLLAAAVGFGGICIAAQNMAVLKNVGVKWGRYIIQRLAVAVFSGIAYKALEGVCLSGVNLRTERVFELVLIVIMVFCIPVTVGFFVGKASRST